jgi:tRNA G18 (ribose-2'-O)-methylase SpoU
MALHELPQRDPEQEAAVTATTSNEEGRPFQKHSEPLLNPPVSRIIPIADANDPRLRHYADLKDNMLRDAERRGERSTFIAESQLVVSELLASGRAGEREILSVLVTPEKLSAIEPLTPSGVPIYVVPQDSMMQVVGFNYHRGVMACAARPPERTLDEVLALSRMLIVLERIANQDNVGAIIRNAVGLIGVSERARTIVPSGSADSCSSKLGAGLLLSPDCCDPLYRKAIRVSSGHSLRVPFHRSTDWTKDLGRVREAGFTLLALTPAPDAVDLREIAGMNLPGRLAILVGAEGPGLSVEAMQSADRRVQIPMRSGTDSLNVAVAAAIAIYALDRG